MIELKVGVVGNDNAPWAYIKQKLSKENIQITLLDFPISNESRDGDK